ncbi:metallophosphoesterase family protein [Bradyrhizobium sp. TZ2]
MARLAIIADVHGNLPALQAVVAAVGDQADHWLCAGDITGHLPLVDEVVDILIGLKARCVLGNHDRAFLDNTPIANSSAGTRVLQLQRHYVSQASRDWLAALPERLDFEIAGLPIKMMHGGPASQLSQRVKSVTPEVREFARGRLLVLGNTHVPLTEIALEHAIVNPGSVGLPTNGDRRAQAAIFDTETRSLTSVRVDYDNEAVVSSMRNLGYDERYFNCLEAGRWIGFKGALPPVPMIVVGAAIYGGIVAELIDQRTDMTLAGFVDDRAKVGPGGAKILGTLDQLSDIAREAGVVDVAVAMGDGACAAA